MESAPLYPSPYPKPLIQKENLTMSQNLSAPTQTTPQLLGPTNTNTTCNFCQASIKTAITYTTTTRTHIAAALCCLVCCLCCIPYCVASARNADHYCPNCHKYLGTYEK